MFGLFKKKTHTKIEQTNTQQKSLSTSKLASGLKKLFSLRKTIDDDLFDELEMVLIGSDIGVQTVDKIIHTIKKNASRGQLKDSEALYTLVQQELAQLLIADNELIITPKQPFVILVVGVNGAGKTTTIGKLAKKLQNEGKSVMLGAGDTFRAAAIEQLQTWGERNNVPVVAGKQGSDSASVLFDALSSARAKKIDVLILDTSGRLHTQDNLMAELAKIKRVLGKDDDNIPHEVMLVVDGTAGQNAVQQAKEFNKAVDLTGISITKLDGTAKGGVVFAISDELKLPIRYIGIGEGLDDLITFNSTDFITSLFTE